MERFLSISTSKENNYLQTTSIIETSYFSLTLYFQYSKVVKCFFGGLPKISNHFAVVIVFLKYGNPNKHQSDDKLIGEGTAFHLTYCSQNCI